MILTFSFKHILFLFIPSIPRSFLPEGFRIALIIVSVYQKCRYTATLIHCNPHTHLHIRYQQITPAGVACIEAAEDLEAPVFVYAAQVIGGDEADGIEVGKVNDV